MSEQQPRPLKHPLVADGYGQSLCEHLAGWRYDTLPPEVTHVAKRLVLDVLGVTAAAREAGGVPALHTRLAGWERGHTTLLLTGEQVSPPSAALGNGTAAHALDFDDQHDPARVHTASVLLPALLATAESSPPVSGRDFLLAVALGAELNARFGLAAPRCLARGWHPTMVYGTLSSAVACARLLGLDARGLLNALGLAYHQAAGSAQAARDGTLAKRLGAGFAARGAVTAAFLALDGFTGPARALEGTAGLFSLYERDDVDPSVITEGLGTRWHTADYSFKPYPCCRCNHTAIDLAIGLHAQGIRPQDVERCEIFLSELNHLTVGTPYDSGRGSIVHAQFNAAYAFAVGLAEGTVGLKDYRPQAVVDPARARFADRTRVTIDADMDPKALAPARVRLHLRSDEVIERGADRMLGSPDSPMTDEQFSAKFLMCAREGFGAAAEAPARQLSDAVLRLDETEDAAATLLAGFAALRAAAGAAN